jgi:hypothetical protein
MGRTKKYESEEEAKNAQKKRIKESNDKTKTREKLFTKYASTQQKELIKTIKSVYIPMAKCEEMIQDILNDKGVKMMTDIMTEKEGALISDSGLPNDDTTPQTPPNTPTLDSNESNPKPKSKGKPKTRKRPQQPDSLLEDIEKLFQKYLTDIVLVDDI